MRNYKISFSASRALLLRSFCLLSIHFPTLVTWHDSCAVIRDKYVYLLYYSGTLNVTKIRRRKAIPYAVAHFATIVRRLGASSGIDLLQLVGSYGSWQVDNITASGTFCRRVLLRSIPERLATIPQISKFVYRPESFAGAFIQFRSAPETDQKSARQGTICIFTSGHYFIVGVKDESRARSIASLMSQRLVPSRLCFN
jgi:TATA-box binding protein (TBP) (component of TFIID and TFIIIB)